eukprot:5251618-Amphidinium_carterae.1
MGWVSSFRRNWPPQQSRLWQPPRIRCFSRMEAANTLQSPLTVGAAVASPERRPSFPTRSQGAGNQSTGLNFMQL